MRYAKKLGWRWAEPLGEWAAMNRKQPWSTERVCEGENSLLAELSLELFVDAHTEVWGGHRCRGGQLGVMMLLAFLRQ